MEQQLPPTRSRRLQRAIDTLGVASVVRRAPATVWQALPAVFAELGIEINFREPATKRVGTCYQRIHGWLGKELVATYIDCGDTRSVPNADSYQVELTVLTTVSADSGGTTLSTFVLGVGQSISSADRVWCRSKGNLEARIREMVEAHLSK